MQTRIIIGSEESQNKYIAEFIQHHSIPPYSQFKFEGKIKIEDVQKAIRSSRVHAGIQEKRMTVFSGELTIPAQNSLLKYLEELPSSDYVFFAVSTPEVLLETIRSRCTIVNLLSEKSHNSSKYKNSVNLLLTETDVRQTLFYIASYISSSQEYEEFILELRQEIVSRLLTQKHSIPVTVISVLRHLLEQNQYVQENNVNPKLALESCVSA